MSAPNVPTSASAKAVGEVIAISGGVASRLMVTLPEALPPADVAAQVKEVPAVSAVSVTGSQPVVDWIVESGSTTFQEMVTSEVYQPLLPKVPVTTGVITGGVVSVWMVAVAPGSKGSCLPAIRRTTVWMFVVGAVTVRVVDSKVNSLPAARLVVAEVPSAPKVIPTTPDSTSTVTLPQVTTKSFPASRVS